MNDILTVAQGTFERFARLKALYVILVICVLDVAAMGMYKDLTMGMDQELMLDCSLAIITAVGLITAMVAAFDIQRELTERTATFILSKPGGRVTFVWGKFFGIGALAVFNIAIVTVGSLIVMNWKYGEINMGLVHGATLVAGEAVALTAIGMTLAMILNDSWAAIGVFAAFAIGHGTFMLTRMMENNAISKFLYFILPNFYNLDIKSEIGNGIAVPVKFVWMGVGYAAAYAVFFVGITLLLFRRKDL